MNGILDFRSASNRKTETGSDGSGVIRTSQLDEIDKSKLPTFVFNLHEVFIILDQYKRLLHTMLNKKFAIKYYFS